LRGRDVVDDVFVVADLVKEKPHTYKTLLGDLCGDGTCEKILRRKMTALVNDGVVFRTSIPGTRFGMALFYAFPKDYHVMVVGGRAGSRVYYFFEYEKVSGYKIFVRECWRLNGVRWRKQGGGLKVFGGDILLWI